MEIEKTFCEECGMKFASKIHLKRHFSNIHLKEKNIKCEYCDYVCHRKDNLKHHSCYTKKRSNPNNKPLSSNSVECSIHTRLHNELNARHEISCPFGRIDLMTTDTIIEIKNWIDHKKGIGQILGYATFFPSYKKRIHFFGTRPNLKIYEGILEVCKYYSIEMTEEDY